MTVQLCYYADDFTGATDSLEVMSTRGIRTMLFLEPPSESWLAEKYPDVTCVGIAGTSRAMTPDQMEFTLKPILHRIKQLNAPITHYKICSTCDSSPQMGSVGKVMDMIKPWFPEQQTIPLLAAAPQLRRYTVFGQHFAMMNEECYRLDRHPVMSQHPITPMKEADLLIHFSEQTSLKIGNINIKDLEQDEYGLQEMVRSKLADVIVFDGYHTDHMRRIGHWLWEISETSSHFVVGSSGIQLALVQNWPESMITETTFDFPEYAGPLLVLSGSCSAVTQKQIDWVTGKGFVAMKLDPEQIIRDPSIVVRITDQIVQEICQGNSVVAYTANGPHDPTIVKTRDGLRQMNFAEQNSGELLGRALGRIGKQVIEQTGLRRMALAGGDTSGFAARELGIDALEMKWPVATGAPLCLCHSPDQRMNGLELALKGGQLGQEDYFERLLKGR